MKINIAEVLGVRCDVLPSAFPASLSAVAIGDRYFCVIPQEEIYFIRADYNSRENDSQAFVRVNDVLDFRGNYTKVEINTYNSGYVKSEVLRVKNSELVNRLVQIGKDEREEDDENDDGLLGVIFF